MHLALLHILTLLVVEDVGWHAVQGEFAREKAILEIPNFLRRTSSSLSVLLLVKLGTHTHMWKCLQRLKGLLSSLHGPLPQTSNAFCRWEKVQRVFALFALTHTELCH